MNKSDKIFIAGTSGMVGSAIIRNLVKKGYANLIGSYHSKTLPEQKDLPLKQVRIDLKHQEAVNQFFKAEKPDYVFLAAAKVGGIQANNTYPAEFIHSNLAIQTMSSMQAMKTRSTGCCFWDHPASTLNTAPSP